MGSTNFRNFGDPLPGEGNAYKLNADSNRLLSRQPSVYSLTFDEFQNTWGGLGKDFGSMNMDELLKNIWNAEESQAMASSGAGGGAAGEANLVSGNLQRQGSLTLPRTLSQKTVDEVWKDLFKETTGAKDGTGGEDLQSLPQRQRTLGEMTLEEFLARVGVVREEPQQIGSLNNSTFYGDLSSLNNNNSSAGLALGFQQQGQSNPLVLDQFAGSNKFNSSQPPSLASDAAGTRSSPQQPRSQPVLQPRPPQPFTKPAVTLAFASPLHLSDSAQLASPGSNGKVGILDHYVNFSTVRVGGTQNGGIGGANLGSRAMVVPVGSPTNQMSPNLIPKGSMDSVSPVPYPLGRGRKPTGSLEKVVERRQRRMIKNRESAARSRARKQAYTLELEAEVAKLKELNEELQRKQEEFMEMQKNQVLQTVNGHWGSKRLCLRRTLTGPW